MKDMGTVRGSAAMAVPLVIGPDTVFVHTDIKPVTEDRDGNPLEGEFQYHEIQYEKDEYIKLMAEQNTALGEEVTTLQLALCDVYEMMP